MKLLTTVLKRLLQLVAILLGLAALVVVGAVAWQGLRSPPQRPASTEKVELTPERVARGKYVFENVAACIQCHAERDFTREGAPTKDGAVPKGQCFDGYVANYDFCAPNLTPDVETGLGGWSDGEVMRAIREGVRKDGSALRPDMPYTIYSQLSDDDTRAVVAYLRSVRPVKNAVPARPLPFPSSLAMKSAPQPLSGPVPPIDEKDPSARAKYIMSLVMCQDCHTPDWGGGWPQLTPNSRELSANLTPDMETGIGGWTKETFVARFKAWPLTDHPPRNGPLRQLWMPWESLAGLTDEDLGAIYDELRKVPAVQRDVSKSKGATMEWTAPTQMEFLFPRD